MTAAFYQSKDTFLVAVDCNIIGFRDNELQILIARRPIEPFKGGWSLMGGFVNAQENINEAAKRVVGEFTGIEDIYLEQVGAYGDVGRDVERVVFVAFYVLVDIEPFLLPLAE